jgi:hypothetical protein
VKDKDSQLWQEVDTHVKAAKVAFAEYKKLGPSAAKVEGVNRSWEDEVKSMLATCVSLGLAAKEVRDVVTGEKDGDGGVGKGIRIDIPEAGTGKRYAEGWIVGKIAKV